MVRRIKQYPLKVLNGISKVEVPVGSVLIGAIALPNTNAIVHVTILEEVPAVGTKLEKETLDILAVIGPAPFSDPGVDKALQFIGTVIWDNGHRVTHVFHIDAAPVYDEVAPPEYMPPPETEEVEFVVEELHGVVNAPPDKGSEVEHI